VSELCQTRDHSNSSTSFPPSARDAQPRRADAQTVVTRSPGLTTSSSGPSQSGQRLTMIVSQMMRVN
jgi:hypothetical protein